MSYEWCTDDHVVIFHKFPDQFSSELPQHIRMIGDDHKFLLCSGSAFYDSVTSKHGEYRSDKAPDIHKRPHLFYILAVQSGFDRDLKFISSVDLCPSGKSRFYIISSVLVTFCDQVILIPQCRSRSDHGHISSGNIPKLRKFIQ